MDIMDNGSTLKIETRLILNGAITIDQTVQQFFLFCVSSFSKKIFETETGQIEPKQINSGDEK